MVTKATAKSVDAWNEIDTVLNVSVFIIHLANTHSSLTKLILLFLYTNENVNKDAEC